MANKVLILTAQLDDAEILRGVLGRAKDGPFEIQCANRLAEALERLRGADTDAILVDLSLPDSQGLETFDKLYQAAPQTPILTLSAAEDEPLAIEAVEHGSQGYLSKGHFGSYLVPQSLRNIIQRKAVEEALNVQKTRAEITLNSISDAVIGTDMAGNVDYLNPTAEMLTGWSMAEAHGRPISEVMRTLNGTTREPERNPIELVLQQDKVMALAAGTILVHRDGREWAIEDSASPIHDSRKHIVGAVMVFHDITAARAMTMKMAHLAQHDFLTDLPNRVLLNDRIAQAIVLAERRSTTLAVMYVDLDRFKHINDSLGHATGDRVLQAVAQRLTGCVRNSDTVSRQGGDEFVVLLSEDKSAEDAALTANKICTALALPYLIAGRELNVTASVGISTYPADAADAEALIHNADIAMYQAKESGRNNYQFFKIEMNTRAIERQAIETDLRQALTRREFILHYQPRVNLGNGSIAGAEALLRWVHPQRGVVLPASFVAIAEESGLIVPIGRWVLREACIQAKRWQEAAATVSIAVNISALEFRHKDFVTGVQAILNETGLAAARLQLEIAESVLMRDAASSVAILAQLRAIGVQLAVDDFGTGYSNLSYLKQFPIDVLKVDRSLVQGIDSSRDTGGVVSAVIAMGSSLMLHVIAEGVEKPAQCDFLKARNCAEGQGNFFSRPLLADQFMALLTTRKLEALVG